MKLTIRDHRTSKGLTLEQLAEKAGISRSYLTELELGAKTINANRLQQIAEALGLRIRDLFALDAEPVAVKGWIDRSGAIHLGEGKRQAVACPPQLAADNLCALEVQDGAFSPIWQDGDILFFYCLTETEPLPHNALNRPAIIQMPAGDLIIGVLRRGAEKGLFHVEQFWPRQTVEYDARITTASRVEMVVPGDLVPSVKPA